MLERRGDESSTPMTMAVGMAASVHVPVRSCSCMVQLLSKPITSSKATTACLVRYIPRRTRFMVWATFLWCIMGLLSIFGKNSSSRGVQAMTTTTSTATGTGTTIKPTQQEVEDRLRGALWGFLAGDALAAPTHWYYGGQRQVIQEYGHPITDYTKPNDHLAGSILNKSNLNGGGRSSSSLFGGAPEKTIIGDVINHGKQDLWSPNQSIHYHATLQKGENTLEAQLARVLMKSMVATHGKFNADHFREAYMEFMQRPNSHNDTYASTCHRMFFSNLIHKKLPPKDCPDNDMHNVDVIDGLVLPTIVSLIDPSQAAECSAVTRKSRALDQVTPIWGQLVQASILQSDPDAFQSSLQRTSQALLGRSVNPRVNDASTMSACYLSQSLPGVLDLTAKYLPATTTAKKTTESSRSTSTSIWQGLLANANVGGENVHRGSLLGALWGARTGNANLPNHLKQGLVPHGALAQEIDAFVEAVRPALAVHCQ